MIDRTLPVLIVEDIQPAQKTLVNFLKVLGFSRFLLAVDGVEAMELLEKTSDIGLIVSDWKMPRMNGLELLKTVRKDDRFRNIPFIMVTSKSEAEDVALAADYEVTCYLIKPITVKELKDKLATLEEKSPKTFLLKTLEEAREKMENEDFYAAERILKNALPESGMYKARIFHELGLLYSRQLQWKEAERMFEKALEDSPVLARAWKGKATVQERTSRWSEAEQSMDKAVSLSPDNAEYIIELGKTQLAQKKFDKAKSTMIRAINSDPRNEDLKQQVWNAYVDLEFIDEAERDFGGQISSSLTLETLNNTAVALRKQGKLKDAIKFYKKALDLDPKNAKLHYNLAVALINVSKSKQAKKHLQDAVEIDPRFLEAKNLLNNLSEDDFLFSDFS